MPLLLAAFAIVATTAATRPDAAETDIVQPIAGLPMSWRVERRIDPGSGDRVCRVISAGGNVTARLAEAGGGGGAAWSIRVGFDNQPGSIRYLRIGRKFFQNTEESFRAGDAAEIVARLKKPGEVAFEWGQRPDYAKRQGLFRTGDFAAKAADCERWVSGTPA